MRDFLLFTGTIRKTAESAEARRENNTSLRLSASSAVNLFCHDPFIQNKLKSHKNDARSYLNNLKEMVSDEEYYLAIREVE